MREIKLFDYQEDMVRRVREAFKHHDAVMVQMPTGTGKTMVLTSIVFSFLEKSNKPVWIVAHRRELVSQIRETIERVFSNHPVPLSKEGNLPTTPSLLHKEGSTSTPSPSSSEGGDVTAPPRRSEPLRSKVGGPSKVSPDCAGWDRLAEELACGLAVGAVPVKVVSIQWLARHYQEMKEKPSLIVIDEAHHALAETYAEVMNAYPKAKKLGLTATPYRMNGKGFTDLFDTLLCSWSMEWFIAEGRLSLYDYYSIKPDSADQLLIDSLQKRGTDGDYQQKELNEVMDVRPSLERLCLTIKQYVPGKKGIVYAISIQHAEHIAEFYRENGIKAVAISSKTPSSLRKELIEKFKTASSNSSKITPSLFTIKEGSTAFPKPLSPQGTGDVTAPPRRSEPLRSKVGGPSEVSPDYLCGVNRLAEKPDERNRTDDSIEVLVSVDLFSEGFDCPDVEFIQLARPTLSLAKYMQMVGRGLRVAEGKEYCVILDNMGLYKRFGLPSADRDWQSMFEGRTSLEDILQEACVQVNTHNCRMDVLMDGNEEMMKVISHERQQRMIMDSYGYSLVENDKGLLGIKDKDGHVILDCQYKKIEVTNDGFAYCYIRKKAGRKEWLDLRNGLWFMKKPQSVRLLGIDFCTEDGKKLYPRIRTKFIDEKAFLTVKTLELQVGTGISWKRRFIPWDEPNKVYMCQKRKDRSRLYIDDNGHFWIQENIGSQLVKADSPEDLATFAQKDKTERENDTELLKKAYPHYEFYPVDRVNFAKQIHRNKKCENEITIEKDGIWHIEDDWYHESYWVDPITHRKHYTKPSLFRRGFVNILKEGDWCYIRNIPGLTYKPLRQWEIVADDNICVINNEFLFVKEEPRICFKIYIRTDDFSYFVVQEYNYEYHYIQDDTEIQITQFEGEGLKMTKEGIPYTPFVWRGFAADKHKWD